jgi:hypothetical protein
VEAMDHALRIQLPAEDSSHVATYRYECSTDQGQTWPVRVDVTPSGVQTVDVGNIENGADYVCRAYAVNAAGASDPSDLSAAVRPCGSLLECNEALPPILALLLLLALGAILVVAYMLYRDRTRGYVVAVVDVVHSANLGHGTNLGIAFTRAWNSGPVTGIAADRGPGADIRIRRRGRDRFEVSDGASRIVATSGQAIIVVDSLGIRHDVTLRDFHTATASPVSSRR